MDLGHGLLQAFEGQDGHDRSEDLLLHHGILKGNLVHDRRLDLEGLWIGIAAKYHLLAVYQGQDAMKMFFVDDLPVIDIIQGKVSILLPDLGFYLLQQLILDAGIAIDVIRSHAGLAAIEIFAKYQSLGSQLQIGAFVYQAGAFSPQLQGDGGKMEGGLLHHFFSNSHTSGKEDVVEGGIEKGGILSPSACDQGDIFRSKALGDQLLHQSTCMGRIGAGLEYGSIAGREGIHQGFHAKQEGIIPGAHDKGNPIGGGLLIASGRELSQGSSHPLLPCKSPYMLQHISYLA